MRAPTIPEKVESMLAALKASGLGPSQIAIEANLSRQTVYRLSVGYCRAPAYDTICAIQRVYAARLEAEE
jgi:DNA-binding phage protein